MEGKALYGCSQIDAYKFQNKLGEGTFGEVYRGVHNDTQTVVALKEILLHNKQDGMPMTALREIRILKSLEHSNVLELLDMAVKHGSRSLRERSTFYIITPYMDHDLAGLLQNPVVRLTLPHIKCYMSQILQGMNYIHQRKYMHRDIKAANILIDNRGNVKLADFGLARTYFEPPPTSHGASPATHRYTATVVTRWYRPPELLLGDQYYTTAIDMWGVGCVFGEIFRRKPIFPGKSDSDQIHTIFKVIGSPNEDSMPGLNGLPEIHHLPADPYPRTFNNFFANVPASAQSLLAGLLEVNPLARLSALGALESDFFTTGPPAAQPQELPIYKSSHELDARRQKQAVRDSERSQQHNGANAPSLPHRPDSKWGERRGPDRRRSKPLGFKLPQRPNLTGIDLVPPYRRNAAKTNGKDQDSSAQKPVAPTTTLDY